MRATRSKPSSSVILWTLRGRMRCSCFFHFTPQKAPIFFLVIITMTGAVRVRAGLAGKFGWERKKLFMKLINVLAVVILAVGVAAFGGCKKSEPVAQTPPPLVVEGVNVELPKLMHLVADAKSTVAQGNVSQVMVALRYGQYDKARADLEKIVAGNTLNEEQKKLAAEIVAQLKQVVTTAGPNRK